MEFRLLISTLTPFINTILNQNSKIEFVSKEPTSFVSKIPSSFVSKESNFVFMAVRR